MKARIPRNMGGGAQNMNQMIKQAQKMQDQITELQEDIEEREFSATAGGGAVEATVFGNKTVKSIVISPDAVDPDDVEMLQDMIVAAINEAMKQADDASGAMIGKMTGGLGGGFPF